MAARALLAAWRKKHPLDYKTKGDVKRIGVLLELCQLSISAGIWVLA